MFFLKYLVNYLKKYYRVEQGPEFVDAMRQLNRPSEVTVPNELIPAGVLMQLRGLFNLHVLSVNADWIYPFWLEQQANPQSPSFVPRAMSLSYINLTHRNWTGIGVLGSTREAVVDPRGLVTPWVMGWSLDTWVRVRSNRQTAASVEEEEAAPDSEHRSDRYERTGAGWVFPSRVDGSTVRQELAGSIPIIQTSFPADGLEVTLETWAFREEEMDYVVHEARLRNPSGQTVQADLTFSLRPCNPEGFSLIRNLAYNTRGFWNVDSKLAAFFPETPTEVAASNHDHGDVVRFLGTHQDETTIHCRVGLATAASRYEVEIAPDQEITRVVIMPMEPLNPRFFSYNRFTPAFLTQKRHEVEGAWRRKMAEGVQFELPDPRYQACTEAAKSTLLLLNDGHEVTAGPMTYHRHWFRDAAYILNALDKLGYAQEVRKNLSFFPLKQWKNGYFSSQKGEWDSNGQAIWSIVEHWRLTGDLESLRELYPAIRKGALWIDKKRHDVHFSPAKPRGLMPAGFSAEHLGPNDYYYWDNFWSLRGMLDAVDAAEALGEERDRAAFERAATAYRRDLEEAINRDLERSAAGALPAAPGRRPDAGMIGNVAAAYPLKLYFPEETPWLLKTVNFIRDHLFHDEGFYQAMIHSGVNSYLTLQVAQCMLLDGDLGAFQLMDYMLKLASPTWCWPEAIHPRTLGGCMGDAHHGWAAAEWVLIMRNLIVHEHRDVLQITRLLPSEWCRPGQRVGLAKAPTVFGTVSVRVEFGGPGEASETLTLEADWRRPPREIRWYLPAKGRRVMDSDGGAVRLEGPVAVMGPGVRRVRLEVDLEHAPSMQEGAVPGLREMP